MTDPVGLSSIASRAPAPTATAAPAPPSADYNAFLRLLMAQLQTQDPTEPMETSEFMGQLATFTQVEQSMATNSKLDALLMASALSQAEQMIGRTVTSADGKISGEVVSVKITADGPLAKLKDGKEILLGPGVTIS